MEHVVTIALWQLRMQTKCKWIHLSIKSLTYETIMIYFDNVYGGPNFTESKLGTSKDMVEKAQTISLFWKPLSDILDDYWAFELPE
jgi:hypothetical protein